MRNTNNDSTCLTKYQEQVELADIFRLYGDDYRRSYAVSYQQLKGHAPYPNMPNR